MSVQFGRWHFGGLPATPGYLDEAASTLTPYGPDGEARYSAPGLDIIYRALHTTGQSRREQQPCPLPSGGVLTWDGRLDNREELLKQLAGHITPESADAAVAAAAYAQWGTNSFAKLFGDWALSVWEPQERMLVLAKDFLGAKHLYYTRDQEQVTWSSILDPLVLLAGKTFDLEEEYIAGWLASFPAAHLTPYVGIHAVPPSTFLTFHPCGHTGSRYWDFDPHKQIRYGSDSEYEEHFRNVFRESVRRRLRSDAPVLAELSGGIDSSSIVCMADQITHCGRAEASRVDTISYYNNREPNWDERSFFTVIEERRGRSGFHVDISSDDFYSFAFDRGCLRMTPASGTNAALEEISKCILTGPYRVVLSGIGGDEMTGGIPSPLADLGDLLVGGHFVRLARQLTAWALHTRKPWLHLLWKAGCNALSPIVVKTPHAARRPIWLGRSFAKRHRLALAGYPQLSHRSFFLLPSFRENLASIEGIRRQLGCSFLALKPPYEKRYPFLDRGLLEFLFAVPPEQVVRPGCRRSLLRRSLASIVPNNILNRRRKAFVARAPMLAVSGNCEELLDLTRLHLSHRMDVVDYSKLTSILKQPGEALDWEPVRFARLYSLVHWLDHLERRGGRKIRARNNYPDVEEALHMSPKFSAENIPQERR